MASSPPEFLSTILKPYFDLPPPHTRPQVTLTFAQSLDAKISGSGGRQLILSGKESMVMTHWMRTMHDAILVGIGTALNDDPQLNVRHLPPPTSTPHHLPRPVIIDTNLQLPPTCKLLKNFQNKVGRRPWVLCSSIRDDDESAKERKQALEAAGAKVIEISSTETVATRLAIASVLQTLRDLGINSLMVEGGARIIASFLAESIVDILIITIAPVLVGDAGVGYQYPTILSQTGDIMAKFKDPHTEIIGQDTVISLIAARRSLTGILHEESRYFG